MITKAKFGKLYEEPVHITEFRLKLKSTKNRGAFKSQLQLLRKVIIEKQKEFSETRNPFKIICFGLIHYCYFDNKSNNWRMFVREISRKKVSQHFSWIINNIN